MPQYRLVRTTREILNLQAPTLRDAKTIAETKEWTVEGIEENVYKSYIAKAVEIVVEDEKEHTG